MRPVKIIVFSQYCVKCETPGCLSCHDIICRILKEITQFVKFVLPASTHDLCNPCRRLHHHRHHRRLLTLWMVDLRLEVAEEQIISLGSYFCLQLYCLFLLDVGLGRGEGFSRGGLTR